MTDGKTNNHAIMGQIIARCWQDEGYKKSFLQNPKKEMQEAGIAIPENIKITVLENTSKIIYSVLPSQITTATLNQMAHNLININISHSLKLPEGGELRFVQSSSKVHYVVLPERPVQNEELSDDDLARVAGGKGGFHLPPDPFDPIITPILPGPARGTAVQANSTVYSNVEVATNALAAAEVVVAAVVVVV